MRLRIIQTLGLLCLSAGLGFGQTGGFSLTTNPNPSNVGQSVTLTAGPVGSFTTVTFYDGGSPNGPALGSASSGQNFSVSISVSNLSGGSHTLIACRPGDGAPICTNTVTQLVTVATSLTLTSSQNPSSPCQTVTFTATVTYNTTSPAPGSVNFFDGTTMLGNAPLSGGSASLTVPSLTIGTHPIQARYVPDPGYLGSSGSLSQVVSSASTVTLSSAPNPSNTGQSVTLAATVAAASCSGQPPSTTPPTGTVFFFDGPTTNPANSIGQSSVSNGTATFSTSSLAAGSHPLSAQYGGDANYGNSTSNTVTQVVSGTKTNTSTTLATSANPISTTQSLTLTATVTPSGATGQVQFKDGANVVATGTLSGGTASQTISNLPAGTHSLTAVYLGDNSFNTSTSNTVNEIVNPPGKTNTTTNLGTSANPITSGQPLTLTANVTPSGATGQVQFLDGGSALGTATLSNGSASFTTSTLSAGPHSLTAVYSGDNNFNASTSNTVAETVSPPAKTNTQTSLSAAPNPVNSGQPLTLTAVVSPTGATGQVQFSDNGSTLGAATLSNGAASFTTSTLSTGPHSLTAVYLGDTNFNSSTSNTVNETVAQPTNQPTSISLSVAPLSANAGQAVIMSAVVTPGTATGTVTFTDNGSTLATVQLSTATASFQTTSLTVGSHVIVAVYNGSTTFNSSSSLSATVVINGTQTQTTLSVSPTASTFGQTVVLSASVTPVSGSGSPTGTVTFSDGNNTLGTAQLSGGAASFSISTLVVGSHSLVASYSGSATFGLSSSLPVNLQVSKVATTTVLTPSPASSNPGQAVTLTAKVTSNTGSGVVTGTVSFLDGSAAIGAPVSVANGSASITTSSLSNGNHSLTAVYSGDSNFLTSTSAPVTESVGLVQTTTTLAVAPASSSPGQAVTLTATVAPTGATGSVTFMDGSAALGTSALSNGTAVFSTSSLSPGPHPLTAVYSGDTRFATSTSAPVSETVGKVNSTTALTATPASTMSGQPVALRATVTPATATGTVAFMDGNTALASMALTAGVATLTTTTLPVGTHSLTAVYSGDANLNGSTSAAVTEVVGPTNPPPSGISPTTLPDAFVGVSYPPLQFTATGGTLPLTWSLLSGSVPGLTLSSGGVLSGIPTTPGTTMLGIRVTDSAGLIAASGPVLKVLAPAVSISFPQPNTPAVSLDQAYPSALVATFAILSFTPNAASLPTPFNNTAVQFVGGGTTSPPITIPKSSTVSVPLPAVQLGSVAGDINVTLMSLVTSPGGQSALPANPLSTIITVPKLAPIIVPGSVKITNVTSTGFSVFLDASSTPRDLTSASLTFTPASGAQLNGSTASVSLNAAAASWFPDTGANRGVANGGMFSLTMPFTYSGDTTAIGTVSVTLTNSVGTSTAVSGGR